MILYCIVTSALNALTSAALAVVVYWRQPRSKTNLSFCWFAATGMMWSTFYFLWQFADAAEAAEFNARLLSGAAILIPAAYYHFVVRLLGLKRPVQVRVAHATSIAMASLVFTDLIVAGMTERGVFPFWPVPGPLYPLYLLFFFGFLASALYHIVGGLRRAEGLRKNQLAFVTAGTAIGFLGGSTNFFLWYDIPVPPVGNGLVALYVVGVGYSIIRFRLMEFNLLAARVIAYSAVVGALATLPIFVLVPLVAHEDELMPGTVFIGSVAFMALLFWLVPELRGRLDAFLERRVLGGQLADRAALRNLASRVSSSTDEAAMLADVEETVSVAFDVADVAFYLRTEFESGYTRKGGTGRHKSGGLTHFDEISPLAQSLQKGDGGMLLEELGHGASEARQIYFRELRERHGVELAVPVMGDTFFYGFLTLGIRSNRSLFNDADVALVEAICSQVGLNLRARQLERRASQTEKLISLGTLAAGLAHELRNPLTSIQTYTALLRERGGEQELQSEFGDVVRRDVERIASIIENVAAFAESNRVDMTTVHLPDVLRTVAEIVHKELEQSGVKLVVASGPVPPVRGNNSQLLQVFLNLVQNAIQALEERGGGEISVGFEARHTDTSQSLVSVIVSDNGPGIDASLLTRIFEPFITTRATGERRGKGGMGLGLAIVKRIVQHHRGEIEVWSVVGRGTTFRVHLPRAT